MIITTAVLTFIVSAVTSFFKNYVFPRFGKFGVQAILFVAALLGATYYTWLQHIPTIAMLVKETVLLFASAIALYEVLLSYFPFFKPTDGATN